MIKFDNKIQLYIDFLNEKYPTNETVQLKPLYGHDCVSLNDDDTTGWAVYIPHSKTIALPMDVPQEFLDDEPEWLFHNLAHEYKHFLDDIAGKKYCKKREKEADEFADKALEEYKLWKKPKIIKTKTMKINKNTLDELIEVERKIWNIKEDSKCQHFLDRSRKISHALEIQTDGKIWDIRFCDLVSICVRFNATNETIYKVIKLLGIEIDVETIK